MSIVATKGINKLVVNHCSRKGTLADVHGLKIAPLVFFDIVAFATVQKYILDTVIATHYVNEVFANHRSMLFAHLIHRFLLK